MQLVQVLQDHFVYTMVTGALLTLLTGIVTVYLLTGEQGAAAVTLADVQATIISGQVKIISM